MSACYVPDTVLDVEVQQWRKYTKNTMLCEKMLIIANYQRNANQNYNELPHRSRVAIIKKTTNTKCWRGCGEKGTLLHCCWECKLMQLLWKTVWRLFKKLNIDLPYVSAIPLLGLYPDKTIIQKDTYIPMFIATLFTIAKTQKQTKDPLADEWIKNIYI